MQNMQQEQFGFTRDEQSVTRFWLRSDTMQVGILDLGGILQSVMVPDKNGKWIDVALGYDSVFAYETQSYFMGALIGRYGNRIAQSHFTLDGIRYTLPANDGRHHLHGGRGFHQRLWKAEAKQDGLHLALTSSAGEEGYPGTLLVRVRYQLEGQTLHIFYQAQTDAPTLCNCTNHAYWNLAGHDAGEVGGHQICIPADVYTPVDTEAIPMGALAPVEGTALDLRQYTPMDARWDSHDTQIQNVGGFDHNFVLGGTIGVMHDAGKVFSPASGITLSVQTTLPGVQFYSGNALHSIPTGKGGAIYTKRSGFCLETQYYPDSVHHPAWPQAIIRPNEIWEHHTSYHFGIV